MCCPAAASRRRQSGWLHYPVKLDRTFDALERLRSRSSTERIAPEKPCVAAAISTVPGAAAACTRAAILGVSPNTSASLPAPRPITTAPESMPILADSLECVGSSLSFDMASTIARR